jgi:hypothetical protein
MFSCAVLKLEIPESASDIEFEPKSQLGAIILLTCDLFVVEQK